MLNRLQEVLELPGLLEIILSYVGTLNLLSMQQVNRASFSSIQQSRKLQRKLGLRPSVDSSFFLPLGAPDYLLPGFSCGEDHDARLADTLSGSHANDTALSSMTRRPDGQFNVNATFTVAHTGNLHTDGNRYCAMAICQPPITRMNVRVKCCSRASHLSRLAPFVHPSTFARMTTATNGRETVASELGLTVGD